MYRTISAIVLVLLLAPDASAQPAAAGQPARTAPMQAEIAAQASFDTSYLLALYMTQLAASGAPPSQADIDEATRQYLTQGAAVTGVPSSGPGAAYFHDGAEVTAYPTPPGTPAQGATNLAGTGAVASGSYEEDAGTSQAVPTTGEERQTTPESGGAQPAPVSEAEPGPRTTGLTCSPREIEAAIAIGGQFATATAPPKPAASYAPSTASNPVPSPVEADNALEAARAPVAEPAPKCPASPSLLARIATAVAGAVLGGLAVALWSRPRPLRVAHGR
jgi:hypothetical protein